MQWSLDQFLERMNDTREEADRRTEAIIDKRYNDFNGFVKKIEEQSDKQDAEEKAERIRARFGEIAKEAADEDQQEKTNDKNKIF